MSAIGTKRTFISHSPSRNAAEIADYVSLSTSMTEIKFIADSIK